MDFQMFDKFLQNLNIKIPTPLSPPQIIKFQLAPCHNPPNNMVFMRLILVLISFLVLGKKIPENNIRRATNIIIPPIHKLLDKKTMMPAISIRIKYPAKVPLRFPPKGMYR